MRRRRPGLVVLAAVAAFAAAAPGANAAPGDLDAGFGAGGIVTTSFPPFTQSRSAGVAVDAQGRIVVAGQAGSSPPTVALARYLPDGSLDPSFGTGGRVLTTFMSGPADATALALQSDGAIVVAGGDFLSSGTEGFVIRYLPAGTPDPSFNGGAPVQLGSLIASSFDALLIQSDGKIVAGGPAPSPGGGFTLTRLRSNGTVDTTFDGDGTANVHNDAGHCGVNDQSGVEDLIALPGGRILVGGICGNDTVSAPIVFGLARFKSGPTAADGALDTTFGTNGASTVAPEPGVPNFAGATARQADGKLIQVGQSGTGGASGTAKISVVRRAADGSLDTGYASGGVRTIKLAGSPSFPTAVTIDPSGRALVAGSRAESSGGFGLIRLTPAGDLDPSFGAGGIALVPFGLASGPFDSASLPEDEALQSDGNVVLAGFAKLSGNQTGTLMRFQDDQPAAPSSGGSAGGAGGDGGGGTTTGSAGAQALPTLGPTTALGVVRLGSLRFDGRRIATSLQCVSSPAAACSGKLTLTATASNRRTKRKATGAIAAERKRKRKARAFTVASAAFSVPVGTTQPFKLSGTRKGAALLKRKHSVRVTVGLADSAGGATTTSRATVVSALKRKRKHRAKSKR